MKKCSTCAFAIFDERLGEYKCSKHQRYTVDKDKDCTEYKEKSKKD